MEKEYKNRNRGFAFMGALILVAGFISMAFFMSVDYINTLIILVHFALLTLGLFFILISDEKPRSPEVYFSQKSRVAGMLVNLVGAMFIVVGVLILVMFNLFDLMFAYQPFALKILAFFFGLTGYLIIRFKMMIIVWSEDLFSGKRKP